MIIIFAGCDCSGKSTCAEELSKYRWEVEKGSVNSDFKDSIDMLKRELQEGKNVIHDRIPLIDDFVYTRIFENRDSNYISCKDEVSEILKKCTVIYFTCSNSVLERRMVVRGDKYITLSQIPQIKREYVKTFNMLDITPVIIDTTYIDKQEMINKVRRIIECI